MVQFDPKILETLIQSSSYFVKRSLKAGLYKGLDEDYSTVGAASVMMCRVDMDDEDVYNICKAVYDHLDILVDTVSSAKDLSVDTGWHVPVKLHPGAEKFFREFGGME